MMEGAAAGLLASLCAGAATGLGALPILIRSELSRRTQDRMIGFSAGVMLSATAFSLLVPALESFHTRARGR
ncbi:MAG TPA: hypothetical protein VEY30_00975 [Myxococcaceae bacterium]|nr:hypothetical protein [Myxococcaceae bacterium]